MIRGGGLDELFEGTKTGVKRSKGNDEEKEQNKSRQMRKNLDNCKFCFSNKKMRDALVYEGQYVYVIVTGNCFKIISYNMKKSIKNFENPYLECFSLENA